MKVAIYHPWIYVKSGLERTILELVTRSRHDWTIYTSHFDADRTYPEFKSLGVIEIDRVPVKRNYFSVLKGAWRMASADLGLEADQPLLICCDGLGSLLTFRNRRSPVACLCFTPLRAVYDEEYRKRHLQKYRKLLPMAIMFEQVYRLIDRWAWKRYDHVFCISETVKHRVLRGGLAKSERIEIAYPGIDASRVAASPVRDHFFFLPGRIMWTKNHEIALRGFLEFKRNRNDDFKLIIAGMVDKKSEPYFAKLKEIADGSPDIEFVCDPSDAAMQDMYRRCYAVLFTAFNEDWGLTPIEGMAFGKPTIAVNRGGPTEIVLNGETGLLVSPEPSAFAEGMKKLADHPDLVAKMSEPALERSLRFTWDVFVNQIDDYLDQLALRERPR
jgi:glycosyltransferase involved in cell wall biosynthesis